SLVGNAVWDDPEIVYQLAGTVTVPAGKQLAIAAGQVIKAGTGDPILVVKGMLTAQGTGVATVIFTSARDDSAGGDTNNNGASAGNNGDWDRIEFVAGSVGNILDH